jgi:hypothetical protein
MPTFVMETQCLVCVYTKTSNAFCPSGHRLPAYAFLEEPRVFMGGRVWNIGYIPAWVMYRVSHCYLST